MAFLMTHSLLSAWLRSMKENPFGDATTEDNSREEFLKVLRREPTETTEAMQKGIDFENLVTAIVQGQPHEQDHKWIDAARKTALYVKGGQLQYSAYKRVTVGDTQLLLHGRLDVLKAGHIYDIKFSGTYDRGKYIDSTQHPMYLELIPEAEDFTYLVSNGTEVWTETYRRDETPSILPVAADFLRWMGMTGLDSIYREKWVAR